MHTDQTDRTQAEAGARSRDPLAGRLLDGRYRIGALIARGGMATVYAATDVRLDRTVAVKVMQVGATGALGGDSDEFAARFVREARAAARLSHPNVVAVFDQGADDGVVYLAMELVEGHTLRDTITRESPIPPRRALALLEPVVSALAAAHRAGLVHRDVKPENVLIADDGRVKVADFGLARAVGADTQHTATQGVLIGTVSYLAPELVVEGRSDARADVYAVGVVLYEMLTGTKPHSGESPIQVAYKHVHHDVGPPSRLVPGLPAYLDALVARATSRERLQRPADAGVLLHQLHRVAQALAEGVADDPELTEDLTPLLRVVTIEPEPGDVPPRIVEPAALDVQSAPEEPAAVDVGHTGAPLRGRRRARLLLPLALVVALLAGGGAYWLGWARYTATPGVIGLPAERAADRLVSAGLELDVTDQAYSETVPEGQVIRTDPGAGSRVLPGGSVEAVVSLGKERYDVPRVRGSSVNQAQDALVALRLDQDATLTRFSEALPEGTVLATRPEAGTTLRPGSAVDLVVSLGPRPIRVGSWVGDERDNALAALDKRGLVGSVEAEAYDDTVPAGSVISQDPPSGTLTAGEEVSLVVSLGPELVEVPRVLAYGIDAATAKLEEQGFEVKVLNDDSYVGLGFVVGTDPGGGEDAPAGSTITLFIV